MRDLDFFIPSEGSSARFQTTHWSVVLEAGKSVSPQSSEALEKLCQTYWQPLYVFIRRKGYPEEDAQDLTQEFFARLLERRDFETVHPYKGKFRTFLLAAMTHFLANERDRARAVKRGAGQKLISLSEIKPEQFRALEPVSDVSPDKLFDLRWAMTVLERALARLRIDSTEQGKSSEFDQLKKFLSEEPGEGEYSAVAQRLGMPSSSVAVAVYRLRARYRELVRSEVAQTLSNPLELEEEMRHLYAVLNAA